MEPLSGHSLPVGLMTLSGLALLSVARVRSSPVVNPLAVPPSLF